MTREFLPAILYAIYGELDPRPKASPAHARGPNVTNSTQHKQSLEAREALELDMMHAQCIHTVD